MIWLVIVALVLVGGGAWIVAKSMQTRLIVVGLGLAAVAAYWFVGQPGMGDRPLEVRLAEARTLMETHPEQLDPRAAIALVEQKIKERPEDPVGYLLAARMHKSVGQQSQSNAMTLNETGDQKAAGQAMGEASAHLEKAEQSFVEYLRHGGDDPKAMGELADLRFVRTTDVDQFTTSLFQTAFAADPSQLRMGYLAGIGLWKEGQKPEAEKIWADVEKRTPPDAPLRQMYAALRQMFGVDAPATPSPTP